MIRYDYRLLPINVEAPSFAAKINLQAAHSYENYIFADYELGSCSGR